MIEVRRAVRSDLPVIARFIRELAEYEKLAADVTFTDADLRATLFEEEKCADTLLAFVEGEPAGFAVYFFAYSTFRARPTLYLEDLFVPPRFRGQGVGKKLFRELLQVAADKRCGRFEWSVLHWNTPAIEFYESLGAQPQKDWIKYRLDSGDFARLLK